MQGWVLCILSACMSCCCEHPANCNFPEPRSHGSYKMYNYTYTGPCILRPPFQPKHVVLKLKVVLKWRDTRYLYWKYKEGVNGDRSSNRGKFMEGLWDQRDHCNYVCYYSCVTVMTCVLHKYLQWGIAFVRYLSCLTKQFLHFLTYMTACRSMLYTCCFKWLIHTWHMLVHVWIIHPASQVTTCSWRMQFAWHQ